MNTTDILISDFTDPLFRQAFTRYFEELGVSVRDWDALFQEMNKERTPGRFCGFPTMTRWLASCYSPLPLCQTGFLRPG